jgi:predicted MFS family arabinose efflux permease
MRAGKAAATAGSAVAAATHRGVMLGSIMSFLSVSAAAVTFPFIQTRRDQLGCDALCQGGQTSLRSGLSLVGAALIGRASDRFGRIPMLWIGFAASLMSLTINASIDSIEGMWYSIIPVALLNQKWDEAPRAHIPQVSADPRGHAAPLPHLPPCSKTSERARAPPLTSEARPPAALHI